MADIQKSKPSMQGGASKQKVTAANKPQSTSRNSNAKNQQRSARASVSEHKSGNDKNS